MLVSLGKKRDAGRPIDFKNGVAWLENARGLMNPKTRHRSAALVCGEQERAIGADGKRSRRRTPARPLTNLAQFASLLINGVARKGVGAAIGAIEEPAFRMNGQVGASSASSG